MEYEVKVCQGEHEETVTAEEGTPLLEAISGSGMELESYCGGRGTCGKCRAVLRPAPAVRSRERELLEKKEIEEGMRLTCLHSVEGNIQVEIMAGGKISILAGEEEISTDVDNGWQRKYFNPEPPSLEDQRSYLTRLISSGEIQEAGLEAIEDLSHRRQEEELVGISRYGELVRVGSVGELPRALGAAVDIGTTTVVVYLLDLETGRQLEVDSFYNPQKEMGADVISRIQTARDSEKGWQKMQEKLVDRLNESLTELAGRVDLDRRDIYRLVFAGNTVMQHGLLGVSSEDIANSPFVPIFTEQLRLKADELGLEVSPHAEVEVFPSISGYVGGDIVADMLAVDLVRDEDFRLLVDIGTNGEVALGHRDKIYACSVAAGPSFEGGNIREGMAALPGALDSFRIEEDGLEYSTIDSRSPRGICGSGLLDLGAGLLKAGVIDSSGALEEREKMPPFWRERYERNEEGARLMLIPADETAVDRPLYFTQKDIRQLQLAKGAIRAGIEILMDRAGIGCEEVEDVYLVGGFANYLDRDNACRIGMIPEEMSDRIHQAGNGAGVGARMMLINRDLSSQAGEYKDITEYLELSTSAEFQQEFTARMGFPD